MRAKGVLGATIAASLIIGALPAPRVIAAVPAAEDQSVTVLEDSALQVTLRAADADDHDLTFAIGDPPDLGALGGLGPPDCDEVGGCEVAVTYTPDPDVNSADSFSFTASDGVDSHDGLVSVTVSPVNDAPSFVAGSDIDVDEDAGPQAFPGWATTIDPGPADEDGQSLDFQVVPDDADLFAVPPAIDAGTGTLTFTPTANAAGSTDVDVTLRDDGGTADGGDDASATLTSTITVAAVNDGPLAVDDAATVAEDATATAIPVLANDVDVDGPSLVITDTTDTANGTVVITGGGSGLTYQPEPEFHGIDTFDYTASDGELDDVATVTITVSAENDAPSFIKGPDQAVNEDAGLQTIVGWATAISPGPSDEAGQGLAFEVVGNSDPGLFSTAPSVSPEGTLTYRPGPNANGQATIELVLRDDGSPAATSASQTFAIGVTAVNDPPVFTPGPSQSVNEDPGPQTVAGWATGIGEGAADESDQDLAFVVTGNTNPTLFSAGPAVSPTGALTYTPAEDATGGATITIVLTDDGGGGTDTSGPRSFTITVNGLNDAPSFTKGADQTVQEDAGPQTIEDWATGMTAGPLDEAGQATTFAVTANTNEGLFAVQPAVATDGTLTYTPAVDAFGSATLTLVLADDGVPIATSASQIFAIDVTAVNDAPSFTPGADQVVAEDAGSQAVSGWATSIVVGPANESDQTPTFIVSDVSDPDLFAAAPQVAADGTLSYTPAPDTHGIATMTVALADSGSPVGTSAAAALTITVTAVNDAPTFVAGSDESIVEDAGPQDVTGWATTMSPGPADETGQSLAFELTTTNDALFSVLPAIAADGSLSYTPAPNAHGAATVTVALVDGGTPAASSDPATFTLTIAAVNDAPALDPDSASPLEDASATAVPVLAGDADVDGDPLTIVGASDPAHGTVAITGGGTGLTYRPDPNYAGPDPFGYSVSDGVVTVAGFVAITVLAVNDAPSFTKGPDQVVSETALGTTRTIPGWASGMSRGPANESSQALAFSTTNSGRALFASQPSVALDGTLTYRQAANRSGVATVTVTLVDSGGTANGGVDRTSATFTITVSGSNDPPIAGNDLASVPEGAGPTPIPVLVNDGDLDIGDPVRIDRVTCAAVTSSTACSTSAGRVAITGGGTGLTFDPAHLFDGQAIFGYRVSDAHGATDTATVLVTVVRDRVGPVMPAAPTAAINGNTTLGASSVAVRIAWPAATDAGSGIARYQLQRRIDRGSWTTVRLSSSLTRAVRQDMTFWRTFEYRVRAVDGEGNVGPWRTSTSFEPVRIDETSRALRYSAGWKAIASVGASGGKVRYTYISGRDVTLTFSGKAVAWVGPRSSTRGSADVLVDGVRVGRFSARQSTRAARQTIMTRSLSGGSHTIVIDSRGGGRIDIDCIVILR